MKMTQEEWQALLLRCGMRIDDVDTEWLARTGANEKDVPHPRHDTEPQLVQTPEPWEQRR